MDLQSCISRHATAAEKVRQLRAQITESEQILAEAVHNGLLPEAADPAKVDTSLVEQISFAQANRSAADQALKRIEGQVGEAQKTLSSAQRRAATARDDAGTNDRELRRITERIDGLISDERLQDIVGDANVELWAERTSLTDALQRRAENADTAARNAREAMATAQRVIDSVGTDGLLPPSPLVEQIARRCQDADLPAWSGRAVASAAWGARSGSTLV